MQTTEPRTPHAYDVVSAYTLNPEDAYASYLRGLGYDLTQIEAEYPWVDDDYDEVEAEDLDECLDALTERLEDIAPDYAYFGATDGDGACFGYWPDIDAAQLSDDVVVIEAGDSWYYCETTGQIALFGSHPIVRDASYVLAINDHGNASLIDARSGRELWSIV